MSSFHGKYTLLSIALLSFSSAALAGENTWPRIENAAKSSICTDAQKIADATYRSDMFSLYAQPSFPQDIASTLVLRPIGIDISGGDALVADTHVFKKIPQNTQDGGAVRSIYWQTEAQQGLRFVMHEDDFGWRGDQYTLFAIQEGTSPEQFMNAQATASLPPLIAQGWRPPFVLQEKSSGSLWAIDVGAPYTFLGAWNAYSVGADGAQQRCTIHFHPEAKSAIALLPQPVQKLATLLDGTLGNGEHEGTLQSTALVKMSVAHMWANVAMRPWAALKAQPYNSREQVDTGLKQWSRKADSFHALYQQIQAQSPAAERALAQYYKTRFSKTDEEARSMARHALDIAIRMYFVFPR